MDFQILSTVLMVYSLISASAYSVENVTVTRKQDSQDVFTKPNATAPCRSFNASDIGSEPRSCECSSGQTYIFQRNKCVTDAILQRDLGFQASLNLKGPNGWNVACSRTIRTVDIACGDGTKNLLYFNCQGNKTIQSSWQHYNCSVTSKHYLDEGTEKWINRTPETFIKLKLEGAGTMSPGLYYWCSKIDNQFLGAIVNISVLCGSYEGHLLFKTAGKKTWSNSIPTTIPKTVTTEKKSSGTSPTPAITSRTTPNGFATTSRRTENRTSGQKETKAVTIAAILIGSIVAVILICIFTWFMIRRRRKRNTPCKDVEDSENPTYGRGPDNIMTTAQSNQNTEENTNYQPIVQNTRASGLPTYEALRGNKQRQLPQNPSIYQALNPDKPAPVQQQSNYEPLVRHRNPHHKELPHEGESSHEGQGDTERDYAVLEGPSENTDRAEAPVYQVLEQGQEEGSPQENNHNEPVYNVLEAE